MKNFVLRLFAILLRSRKNYRDRNYCACMFIGKTGLINWCHKLQVLNLSCECKKVGIWKITILQKKPFGAQISFVIYCLFALYSTHKNEKKNWLQTWNKFWIVYFNLNFAYSQNVISFEYLTLPCFLHYHMFGRARQRG